MNKIEYENTSLIEALLGPFPDETILAGADRILKLMEPNSKASNDSLVVLLSPQFSNTDTSESYQTLKSEMDVRNTSKINLSEETPFEKKSNFIDKESADSKFLKKLSEIENVKKDLIINKIKKSPTNSQVSSKIIENKEKKISDDVQNGKIRENSKKRKSKIPVLSTKAYQKDHKVKLQETIIGETEVNIYEDNSRIFQIGKSQEEIENGEAFIYAMLQDGSSACFQILSIDDFKIL